MFRCANVDFYEQQPGGPLSFSAYPDSFQGHTNLSLVDVLDTEDATNNASLSLNTEIEAHTRSTPASEDNSLPAQGIQTSETSTEGPSDPAVIDAPATTSAQSIPELLPTTAETSTQSINALPALSASPELQDTSADLRECAHTSDAPLPTSLEAESEDMPESVGVTENVSQRRSQRARKPPAKYQEHAHISTESTSAEHADAKGIAVPKTYSEAIKDPRYAREWKLAIEAELLAHVNNSTWTVVTQPARADANIIDCKWVFKVKYTDTGALDRFKARLVARGFTQVYGLDYEETFAPTLRKESLRVLFALAATKDWHIHQMDVDAAYLTAEVEEELYMRAPEGLRVRPDQVCKLGKGLYGLKQSGRNWNRHITQEFNKLGYCATADPSVFRNAQTDVIIALYVDDLLIFSADLDALKELKAQLKKIYSMKDLGEARFCLGVRITRNRAERTIMLDQKQYTIDLLARYSLQDSRAFLSPIEGYTALQHATDNDTRADQHKYQKAVGELLYLSTVTRWDITFAVNQLAQYTQDPSIANWNGIMRVLRYLQGTASFAQHYGPSSTPLQGYSDSDYAAASDCKCVSGYIFTLNGGAITWNSQKQRTIVTSTTEAEYIGLCNAGKEAIFLAQLLESLGAAAQLPITIYGDNNGALALTTNPEFHSRTKHIDIRYHYIRQLIQDGRITTRYISTDAMAADCLTKPLHHAKTQTALTQLALRNA